MKITKLSLWSGIALSLCLALGSCSDKDVPDVPTPDEQEPEAIETSQLRFVIKSAWDNTRAGNDNKDGVFENGDKIEGAVENIIMVFFKGEDFFYATEPHLSQGEVPGDYPAHTMESVYSGNVTLRAKDGKLPTDVLCIVNGKGQKFDYDGAHPDLKLGEVEITRAAPNKEAFLKCIETFRVELNDDGTAASKPLMMTNSVYVEKNETPVVNAMGEPTGDIKVTWVPVNRVTPIDKDCFIMPDDPRDKSTIPAVHIDVERVNARVQVINELAGNITESKIQVTSGEEYVEKTVIPVIKNIRLGQMTRKSYFVKSLDDNKNYSVLDWQSAMGYPRSYWADAPKDLKVWKDTDKDTGAFLDSDSDYEYYSWNEMLEGDILLNYPQENTTEYPTCIVVTAQLQDEEGNVLEDLVDLSGNRRYFSTMDDFRTQMAIELQKHDLKYTYQTQDAAGNAVTEQSDDWKKYVKLKRTENPDHKSFHVIPYVAPLKADELAEGEKNQLDEKDADRANAVLSLLEPVMCYKDGMCYYYVEILHDLMTVATADEESARAKGVVRNHAYTVTLKTLKGLGSPVYDPNQSIIPNRPDEVIELNADVHALQWKVVTQQADLQ